MAAAISAWPSAVGCNGEAGGVSFGSKNNSRFSLPSLMNRSDVEICDLAAAPIARC